MTDKYKLDLNGAWNKQLMPYQGRHPNAYHNYMLKQIQKIDKLANGNTTIFLQKFESVKQTVFNNPAMLYKDYWMGIF